jgi:hypothetical protein
VATLVDVNVTRHILITQRGGCHRTLYVCSFDMRCFDLNSVHVAGSIRRVLVHFIWMFRNCSSNDQANTSSQTLLHQVHYGCAEVVIVLCVTSDVVCVYMPVLVDVLSFKTCYLDA